ncbi:MAG: hypothetical protein KDK91_06530 [Gammaproteobacteria bacterium]|nr:hypothetical protein [Gammaproteobacteria bacterium]
MNTFKLVLRTVGALLVTATILNGAQAGTLDGQVVAIIYQKDCSSAWNGCVKVQFSTPIENPASCQWMPDEMMLDYNSPNPLVEHHRVMLQMLELALTTRARVVVAGTGDCTVHANAETIRDVTLLRD